MTWTGKALWSVDVPGVLVGRAAPERKHSRGRQQKFVREINRQGETVWEWTAADAPDTRFSNIQIATRLPNGNTIINNWFNQWSGKLDPANAPVQAIEVTPDKKVVWALRSWDAARRSRPVHDNSTAGQIGRACNFAAAAERLFHQF